MHESWVEACALIFGIDNNPRLRSTKGSKPRASYRSMNVIINTVLSTRSGKRKNLAQWSGVN